MAEATRQTSLIPELQNYREQFLQAQRDIAELVDGMNDGQFNWRPGEDEWSAAECIDHLMSIGTLMMRKLDEGIETATENDWRSEGPFKYRFLGNFFVKLAGPRKDMSKGSVKTPGLYAPTSNHTISRLQEAFTGLQDDFLERLDRANGLDLARARMSSPAAWFIRLSLGQWFALLAGHQTRHFQQAQAVKARLPESLDS